MRDYTFRQIPGVYNALYHLRHFVNELNKSVRRLEQAGMSPELAEVQAEVLTEAFTVNLESLVTKEYLESRLDARFAEQRAYIDTRFAELKADFDGKFRTLYVMFAVIMAGVILPYLERILAP